MPRDAAVDLWWRLASMSTNINLSIAMNQTLYRRKCLPASRHIYLCLLAFSLLGVQAHADDEVLRMHKIQIDDYFTIHSISGCQASPDGRKVFYTEQQWDVERKKKLATSLVLDTSTGKSNQLVPDDFQLGSPVWDTKSEFVYFLHKPVSKGEENKAPEHFKRQVWRVKTDGGEPNRITYSQTDVGLFDIVEGQDSGPQVYYSIKQTEGQSITTGVYRFDIKSSKSSKECEITGAIKELAVSPDGRYIAMATAPDDTLLTYEGRSHLIVQDTHAGKHLAVTQSGWRKNHPSPFGWIGALRWADDSAGLACAVGFDGYAPVLYVVEFEDGASTLHAIDRPSALFPLYPSLQWRPGSRDLMFLSQEKAHQRLYSFANVRDGKYERLDALTPGDVVLDAFTPAGPSNIVAIKSTTTQPQNLFLLKPLGVEKQLTDINPHIDTWDLPSISTVQWKNESGQSLSGILELPSGHKRGEALPMVVFLHGGPTSTNLDRFRFWRGRVLFAAQGYAVFCPDYRGSSGYGDQFTNELIGHTNDREVKDVLSGVEAMIERDIADPDRIGVMGWSNGGYLTNCLITQSKRFKAASSGAGIVDMHLQWGLMDTPGWVMNFMGGLPWEKPDVYRKASPIDQMDKATAATLIHVGSADPRCPPANAHMLYRALKQYGKVDTELLIYPGEGHRLKKYDHLKTKIQWDLAWFNKHLRGSTDPLPARIE